MTLFTTVIIVGAVFQHGVNMVFADRAIRLVKGSHPWEGRVEVYRNGQWGTVCNRGWDDNDAKVVCRQLGFGTSNGKSYNAARLGQRPHKIWMWNVSCEGSEDSLLHCRHDQHAELVCRHNQDVGLSCNGQPGLLPNPPIRLVNGQLPWEGRVEVYVDGQWGTVCDHDFNDNDARVVCRELGFDFRAPIIYPSAYFGQGKSMILMTHLMCAGFEVSLFNCSYNTQTNKCGHHEDAGLSCYGGDIPSPPIRLVNGSDPWEGRVEVYVDGQWGTVCDDDWDDNDARVVCRELGYNMSDPTVYPNAYFGEGKNMVLMTMVMCNGTENSLLDCTYNNESHVCRHHEVAAGLSCYSGNVSKPRIRLVNAPHPWEGRVEVYVDGRWGTVCDDRWDDDDTRVVCRQLGFDMMNARAFGHAFFGQGSSLDIVMDNVACKGNELHLINCSFLADHNCGQDEVVGVVCSNTSLTGDKPRAPIRLVNGPHPWEGRVEVYLGGRWGTVCDDHWDDYDARVVCRQLGYSTTNATAHRGAVFGQGSSLEIVMDNVACKGNELRLINCVFLANHNCHHNEDVGVACSNESLPGDIAGPPIRLVNGSHPWEGRVEVYVDGQWGTVCDDHWDYNDARVVCRELGFNMSDPISYQNAYFGVGKNMILMTNLLCNGEEDSLVNCPYSNQTSVCGHKEDAGLACYGGNLQTGIRLVNGSHPWEGRVEMYVDGQWGTVCDHGWDRKDAMVACRQLGFNTSDATPYGNSYFGQGIHKIWLLNVNCDGYEDSLLNCVHDQNAESTCSHDEDAGLSCNESRTSGLIPDPPIRLVDGPHSWEGRVEVYMGGVWGTVCDHGWDRKDTVVACRQLGFGTSDAKSYRAANLGEEIPIIWMWDVNCVGNEDSLLHCKHQQFAELACTHREDVGLSCSNGTTTSGLLPDPPIRLVDGSHPWEGRVEVYVEGVWGTVCDHGWDRKDTVVACRQLGFGTSGAKADYFGTGTHKIWLTDVNCEGSEDSLLHCRHDQHAEFVCRHYQDVGLSCKEGRTTSAPNTKKKACIYGDKNCALNHEVARRYEIVCLTTGLLGPILLAVLTVMLFRRFCPHPARPTNPTSCRQVDSTNHSQCIEPPTNESSSSSAESTLDGLSQAISLSSLNDLGQLISEGLGQPILAGTSEIDSDPSPVIVTPVVDLATPAQITDQEATGSITTEL